MRHRVQERKRYISAQIKVIKVLRECGNLCTLVFIPL